MASFFSGNTKQNGGQKYGKTHTPSMTGGEGGLAAGSGGHLRLTAVGLLSIVVSQ